MVLVLGCAGLYNRRMVNANLCWDKQQIHRPRLLFVCDRNLRMKKTSQSTLKTWTWAYLLPRGDPVRTSPLAVHIRNVLQRGPPVCLDVFLAHDREIEWTGNNSDNTYFGGCWSVSNAWVYWNTVTGDNWCKTLSTCTFIYCFTLLITYLTQYIFGLFLLYVCCVVCAIFFFLVFMNSWVSVLGY